MAKEEKVNNTDHIDLWMIRPCEIYRSEYDECTSIVSRLHQMFIFGSTVDCNHWRDDYNNCVKWRQEKNTEAADALVLSEKNKRITRLKSHYANNVWENRTSPPENWNDPLPDYIAKRKSQSTLQDTINEENENSKSFCSIM